MTQTSDFSFPHSVPPGGAAGHGHAAPQGFSSYAESANASAATRDCVIVADDSELSLSIVRRILYPHFDLLEAHNGAEIVQFLRNPPKPVSAVLLDMMMPVMDGFQVMDFMQKNGLLGIIPVVVATALADAQSKIQCYEAGAFDVLDKPLDSKFLPFKLRWDIDRFRHLRALSANPVAQARTEQLEALLSAIPAAIFVEDPASNVILHCNDIFLQIPGVPENPVGQSIDTFPLSADMHAAVRSARDALLVHNIAQTVVFDGSVPGSVYSLSYTTFPNPVSSVTQLVGFITNVSHTVQNRSAFENRMHAENPYQ